MCMRGHAGEPKYPGVLFLVPVLLVPFMNSGLFRDGAGCPLLYDAPTARPRADGCPASEAVVVCFIMCRRGFTMRSGLALLFLVIVGSTL